MLEDACMDPQLVKMRKKISLTHNQLTVASSKLASLKEDLQHFELQQQHIQSQQLQLEAKGDSLTKELV